MLYLRPKELAKWLRGNIHVSETIKDCYCRVSPSEDPYARSTRVLQRPSSVRHPGPRDSMGFDALYRILISQTFLSPDKNGFSRSLLGVRPGDVSPL